MTVGFSTQFQTDALPFCLDHFGWSGGADMNDHFQPVCRQKSIPLRKRWFTIPSRMSTAPCKLSSRACGPVGVGIAVARDPLRRSGQALLTHPAPTLGDNA